LDRVIIAEPERHETVLAANDAALRAPGHWGVPTAVFQSEPFFGQDRLETLVWRLRQHGLGPRG
jgi:2-hydroxychromene-2-carboxylate isomerase